MNMILNISLRNLLRQKRRNMLLGISMAFGMMVLFVANAFSGGISDILLNKIILWITGHVRVTMLEKDQQEWSIIRDKTRIEQAIRANFPPEIEIFEDVSTEGRKRPVSRNRIESANDPQREPVI